MKKIFNFRNFGVVCAFVLCGMLFSSYVKWSAPMGIRNCYAEIVELEGHKYVIATTGASDSPGVSIVHAASCLCNKK